MLLIAQVSCGSAANKQSQDTAPLRPVPTLGEQFIKQVKPTPPSEIVVQPAGVIDFLVRVDVTQNIHPISPLIYGVSGAPKEVLEALQPTMNSWGGNPSTRYNWRIGNAWNAGSDWSYRNGNYGFTGASASDQFMQDAQDAGIITRLAFPTLGWVAKDDNNDTCSFPQPDGTCGDARGATCASQGEIADPTTANVTSDPASITEWVTHLTQEKKYTLNFLALDNEPELWGYTHYDVHPTCTTYYEILTRYIQYTQVVHQAAPEAQFVGPVTCCWQYYWDSAAGPVDKLKHGNKDFLPWFLENIRQQDQSMGWRSLHVLDIHYYPEGIYNNQVDETTAARRLRSTRSLWDETYTDESWIAKPVYLIPRMKRLLDLYYPETRLGISEWNWGAEDTMNGALAIADVLGIFGQQDLYYAAYWQYPRIGSPGFNAFKLFTNYDGEGSRFGDTSVWSETSDRSQISSYAALDSQTGSLHVMLINKNPETTYTTTVKLNGYSSKNQVELYRYDSSSPKEITQIQTEKTGDALNLSIPPYSITLLIFKNEVR